MAATTEQSVDHCYRLAMYIELGFTDIQSELLASAVTHEWAKDKHGREHLWQHPLNWARVAEALSNGCSHELAVEIFA